MAKAARRSSKSEGGLIECPIQVITTTFYYVYLLRSLKFPHQTYIGFSEDFQQRFKDHSNGKSVHTAKYRPWELVSCHAFTDLKRAKAFEAYLKTGSGRAFAKRHFW